MNNRIVVDSCVDMNDAIFTDKVQLERVPFKITIDDEEIGDRNLDRDVLISKMKASKKRIITACPSPGDYLAAYNKMKSHFVVTISSKLSGSHGSAMIAKDIFHEVSPEHDIHILDSKTAAAGETMVTFKLKQLLEDNLNMSQIVEKINHYIDGLKTLLILDSLDNLSKNGRISSTKALIGTLLHITPIMGANDGEIVLKEQVRGKKRAFNRLVEMIGESNVDYKNTVLGITHINALEKAEELKAAILNQYPFKEILVFKAGGLSTVYADDGGIVIAY